LFMGKSPTRLELQGPKGALQRPKFCSGPPRILRKIGGYRAVFILAPLDPGEIVIAGG